MRITKANALAFLDAILSGKGATHLEAVLGHGNVPKVSDFEKYDLDGQERADKALKLLKAYVDLLYDSLGKLEEEETANSLPGTMPADLEPVKAADEDD